MVQPLPFLCSTAAATELKLVDMSSPTAEGTGVTADKEVSALVRIVLESPLRVPLVGDALDKLGGNVSGRARVLLPDASTVSLVTASTFSPKITKW